MVEFCPSQTGDVVVNVEVGVGFTATVTKAVPLQLALLPVTVYIVAVAGVATTLAVLVALNPVGGAHV
jgi:hypothetical protein